jgi:hypothetical protein
VQVRNDSFNAGFTQFEGLDAMGIHGVPPVAGVLALHESLEASRCKCSFSGFWGGIGRSAIIGNLVFLKTVGDLNSLEPEDEWNPPLTAKASRDDIIHANEVSLTGPAATYACRGLA